MLCHLKVRRKKFRIYRCHPVDPDPTQPNECGYRSTTLLIGVVFCYILTQSYLVSGLSPPMCDVCPCLDQVGECQVTVQLRPSQQRQENLPASQTPARSVLLTLPDFIYMFRQIDHVIFTNLLDDQLKKVHGFSMYIL